MKYINKTSGSIRLAALWFGAALLGLMSQNALAVCTPGVNCTASGTVISNSASLAYSVGGVGQAPIVSAGATFTVDNKVNLTVAKLADANIYPNSTNQVLYFSVTNNGNTSQSYALSTSVNGVPTATTTIVGIYNDNSSGAGSGPGVYNGTNTPYVAGTATVAADSTIKVLVVADQTAPAAANGQTSAYNLIAQTTNAGTAVVTANASGAANTPGVDVVWADAAGSADSATDGKHSAFATYTVVLTVPTVVKTSALLCDPVVGTGTPHNIPGSLTQWTIVVTNPGANPSAVTLTTITDALTVAQTTMDPGAAAGLNIPASAATCVVGGGPYGFKVTVPVARVLGGSLGGSGTTSYFTTTSTVDGVDFVSPTITATFANILPIDGATSHPTAGLLLPGESVTLIFNTRLE